MEAGGTMLSMRTPDERKMQKFMEHKCYEEATIQLVEKCTKCPRTGGIVRRVVMSWQMQRELNAIVLWIKNMLRQEKLETLVRLHWDKVIPVLTTWYFGCLIRPIARWMLNMKASKAAAVREAAEAERQRILAIKKFATDFVNAIDDDGDGGLSLCELKSAELGNTGSENPLFAKAAIWLQSNRNFQKYDVDGIGIIDEVHLLEAMEVFLKDHWKFDGTLW